MFAGLAAHPILRTAVQNDRRLEYNLRYGLKCVLGTVFKVICNNDFIFTPISLLLVSSKNTEQNVILQ
jgi:hypothetical protein